MSTHVHIARHNHTSLVWWTLLVFVTLSSDSLGKVLGLRYNLVELSLPF